MNKITASVGQGGSNQRPDVVVVQDLLRARGLDPGRSDGVCGERTIAAIRKFQARFMAAPDGLVEPDKTAWMELAKPGATVAPKTPAAWLGDSAQWPQEKKLQSMNPQLAIKVRGVLDALGRRGFQPKVFYGWRSVDVQARLYAEGKSKVRFSFHNAQKTDGTPYAYAADIIDSRYAWTQQAESSGFWTALGEEAKRQGLVWGGDWASFRDWAHVQLVANGELARVKQESGL
jgi:peptidoglycan L-alanyl-D-glutamate endopeptidase CwlK